MAFTCRFAVGYNDLVLTKNVAVDVSARSQPTAYTVVGSSQLPVRSPTRIVSDSVFHGSFTTTTLAVLLEPAVEAIQEQWIRWCSAASPQVGQLIYRDIGVSGPHSFTIEPTAGTGCGLGLDGSDATFISRVEVLQADGECGLRHAATRVAGDIPNEVQAVISGIATGTVGSEYEIRDCSGFNGTYLLEDLWTMCLGVPVRRASMHRQPRLVDTILLMKLSINGGGNCGSSGSPGDYNWFLEIVEIDPF